MSTTEQLSENSHQGFEAAKLMLCLAAMQVKSNTASWMPVCLRQNGIGSRSSSKERDAETGLDYFGARYYSGAQGRFTSVDPGLFTIADPQSWNRYSYVQNNPLNFVDPKGTTLFLTGDYADDLMDELHKKTGLHLTRDADTGEVTIDKGSKRDTIGSKSLANKIKNIIGDDKTEVSINTVENQEDVKFDSFANREIDVADYRAFDASSAAFAGASLGYVLQEYYWAEKHYPGQRGRDAFNPAHKEGMKFEMGVMQDFTGKPETMIGEFYPNAPNTDIQRFDYSSVTYDVLWKSGAVEKISKTEKSK
jgi:RHS repeat-associated protein